MPRRNAAAYYLVTVAVSRFADRTMFTTSTLYYVTLLGLTPLQLVLLGTALELAILLGEVPTGVVADTYGRRRSVATGYLTLAVSYLLQGALPLAAVPAFPALLGIQALRGLGHTFLSGAHVAWITDEVGRERAGELFVRAERLAQLASVAGILAGTGLALWALHAPYLVGGSVYLALGALALTMPETAFRQRPRPAGAAGWSGMAATLRDGLGAVRAQPLLAMVMVVSAFAGAASEGWDRLGQAHFLLTLGLPGPERLEPAAVFGLMALAGLAVNFLALAAAGGRLVAGETPALARRLVVLTALRAAGAAAFALATGPAWGLAAYWLVGAARALYEPLYQAWLNRLVDARVRATVLSLEGQANAVGETAGGPVVGVVAQRLGLRAALLLGAVLLLPPLALFRRASRSRPVGGRPPAAGMPV